MSHSHSHSHSHPLPKNSRILGWTIIFNVVITVTEFVAGALTGVLALVADATHNLSDVAGLVLAYFGEKTSEAPATKTATYGRRRMEVFTALISATSLVLIAGYIVYEAYGRFVSPQPIENFTLFIIVATIGLLGNVASVWILRKESVDSINRKAALLHMVYDGLSSVAVIIGGIVMYLTDWTIVDPILSVMIAGMIIWSSLDVFKRGWQVFMEATPIDIDFDDVMSEMAEHESVQNAHHLHIWSLSSTETALSCHVCVATDNLSDINQILVELNQKLKEKFGISHATIQVETGPCSDPNGICSEELHSETAPGASKRL